MFGGPSEHRFELLTKACQYFVFVFVVECGDARGVVQHTWIHLGLLGFLSLNLKDFFVLVARVLVVARPLPSSSFTRISTTSSRFSLFSLFSC
jgi:hypothetical protein